MASEEGTIRGYAAYEAGLTFKPFEYKARTLGATDVEIAIHYSGICHSDLHTSNGEWGPVTEPVVVGHEIAGVVTAVGSDVTGFKVGDRAAVGPQVLSCGQCRQCSKLTLEQYCGGESTYLFNFGKRYPGGELAHGGYALGIRVHQKHVFAVPEALPLDVVAPLLCAGVTVFRPLRAAKVGPGMRVGVIGIGGLGHLAIQYASKMGAEVVAISSSQRKEAEAKELGATRFVNSSVPAELKALQGSLDLLIMTASFALDWNAFFALLNVGGHFVFLGLPSGSTVQLPVAPMLMTGYSIGASLIGSVEETRAALEFAAQHGVRPWIRKMPLDQVNEAVAIAYNSKFDARQYRVVLDVLNGSSQLKAAKI